VTPSFSPLGVIFITLGLVADAFVGNIQERALRIHKSTLQEVVFHSYLQASVILLVFTAITGGNLMK